MLRRDTFDTFICTVISMVSRAHVACKGSWRMQVDIVGRHVMVAFDSLQGTLPHLKSGQLRTPGKRGEGRESENRMSRQRAKPLALTLAVVAAACVAACAAPSANAQKYPEKSIRYISPYPTGASQILALLLSEKLGAALGQPVYVDFRPGAGGNIGMELAAKAPPDGYTLLQATSSMAIGPSLYKKLGFNAARDFQAVSQTANVPNLIVVHPSVPAKSLNELVQVAKAHPGKLSYGSGGVGSGNHLASEMFKSMASINLIHVPYKGASIALTHILSGEIDVVTVTVPATIPFLNSGKLRGLAILARERAPTLPNLPTSKEAGFAELLLDSWYGIMVPTGVRPDIIERLNSELKKIIHAPDTVKQLARVGIDAVTSTPAEFQAFVKADAERWAKVIREAGIRIE